MIVAKQRQRDIDKSPENIVKNAFMEVFVIDNELRFIKEQIGHLQYQQSKGSGEGVLDKLLWLRAKEGELLTFLLRLEGCMMDYMDILNPKERAILTWRYICRLAWKIIAKKAGFTVMQCLRIHDAAMEQITHKISC